MVTGILLAIVVLFGLVLLLVIYYAAASNASDQDSRSSSKLDVEGRWAEISTMLSQGGPANFRVAIIEGDKLVDNVLKGKVRGKSMGERLKNAKSYFTPDAYNKLWMAHKIRNKVAHEADFEGLSSDARVAVSGYEKALRELGFLTRH